MTYYLTYKQTIDGVTKVLTMEEEDFTKTVSMLTIIDHCPDTFRFISLTAQE